MKKIKLFIAFMVIAIGLPYVVKDQEKKKDPAEKYRIIAGVRVNPLIIYDLQGNSQ